MMEFDSIDHVVFTVRDIQATCEFYSRVLGIQVVTYGEGRVALQVGRSKINLHQQGREFEPKALLAAPGSQDICLLSRTSTKETVRHLRHVGVDIILGPIIRTGAIGHLESVYLRDPDGNLVEIAKRVDSVVPDKQGDQL